MSPADETRGLEHLLALLPDAKRCRVGSVSDITVALTRADCASYYAALETLERFGEQAIAFLISDIFDDCHFLRVTYRELSSWPRRFVVTQ